MKKIRILLLVIFTNILIFEFFSFTMCTIFDFCPTPSYSLTKNDLNHWNSHDVYGVWHKENSKFTHQTDCFSAKYYFNNFGAKDKDRKSNGKNRTLIVGDSYAEGYGVDNNKIFSYLMEKESYTNEKYLNFSTSGYFGSTQYYILIKDLLEKLEIDRVFLFINPGSDFKDDSYEFGKLFHYKKYRPYLDLKSDKIIYYNESYKYFNNEIKLKNVLDNYTYSYKFLRYLKHQIVSSFRNKKISDLNNKNSSGYASYYEKYPNDTYTILKKNLLNIYQILFEKNIKLIVFSIPSKKDLLYFNSKPEAQNKLDKNLNSYLEKFGVNFFSFLSPDDSNNRLQITNYFECTDHLNEEGHKIFKNIIRNNLLSINEEY